MPILKPGVGHAFVVHVKAGIQATMIHSWDFHWRTTDAEMRGRRQRRGLQKQQTKAQCALLLQRRLRLRSLRCSAAAVFVKVDRSVLVIPTRPGVHLDRVNMDSRVRGYDEIQDGQSLVRRVYPAAAFT